MLSKFSRQTIPSLLHARNLSGQASPVYDVVVIGAGIVGTAVVAALGKLPAGLLHRLFYEMLNGHTTILVRPGSNPLTSSMRVALIDRQVEPSAGA